MGLFVTWVPDADAVPAERGEGSTCMANPQVLIGLDVGKAEHHCVALNLAGDRLVDRPLPNDAISSDMNSDDPA